MRKPGGANSDEFRCPTCQATYMLVRIGPEDGYTDAPVACVVCSEAFTSREGTSFLKYFLMTRPARSLDKGGPH